MHTILFTGNGGAGSALAAAATAAHAASQGRQTLLISMGPSHSLEALLGQALGSEPIEVGQHLAVWQLDIARELGDFWRQLRGRSGPNLSADELPLLPGTDLLAGFAKISQLPPERYDLVVIEAGNHDSLLRALAVPDSVRWAIRVTIGIDRGPGRGGPAFARSVIPSALLPFEWVDQIQEARIELERVRDRLANPATTRVRYVLRPDRAALSEARLALPALQLYGLAVEAVVAAPLLPNDGPAALCDEQRQVCAEAMGLWAPRPLLHFVQSGPISGVSALQVAGSALAAGNAADIHYNLIPPIEIGTEQEPSLTFHLPGIPTEAMGLTLSGDEIIIKAGPYRRHVLLPEGLRSGNLRAARAADRLTFRRRTS